LDSARKLFLVRALHTGIWFAFATTIIALPFVALWGDAQFGLWLAAFISIEVVVLLANRMRCPLRDVAGRYTEDRADGFDIYLPGWLAARTKIIFTPILALGLALLALRFLPA
jgi:hypothetical protein